MCFSKHRSESCLSPLGYVYGSLVTKTDRLDMDTAPSFYKIKYVCLESEIVMLNHRRFFVKNAFFPVVI